MRILAAILVLCAAATYALAPTPVGKWSGAMVFDMSKLPKVKDPQQKAMMDQQLAVIKKMKLLMVIKADKTFTSTASGVPGQTATMNGAGTWSQKGQIVTLVSTKVNGKAVSQTGKQAQAFTLSSDGKKLSANLPQGIRLTFSRK